MSYTPPNLRRVGFIWAAATLAAARVIITKPTSPQENDCSKTVCILSSGGGGCQYPIHALI